MFDKFKSILKYLLLEQNDDFEDDRDDSEEKPNIGQREEPGKDFPLNQMQIGKEIRKDVSISSFIVKGPRPWTLEYTVEFYMSPKSEFVKKHTNAYEYVDKEGNERIRYGGLNATNFLKGIENRFGRIAIYHIVNKVKKEIDEKFKDKYPILKWSDPGVAYVHETGLRRRFVIGTEGGNKSVQTRQNKPTRLGYYLRFDLPLHIQTEEEVNRQVSYKAEMFKQKLIDIPIFKNDEDFDLSP